MKVLLAGGGTGGHITPPLAVARKLKQGHPNIQIHYVLEKGSKFAALPRKSTDIDQVHTVFAGKFRRYHGESFLSHLFDIKTNLKNIRDFFALILGIIQSVFLVRIINPQAVFVKGGFVGVPIGIACALWRIPFFTHDSDTVPGLANRLISRWAKLHAVGMPVEFYNYPKEAMRYVGIPVSAHYERVTPELKRKYRDELHVPKESIVICITGGSQGAMRLNESVVALVPELMAKYPNLQVLHQTGSFHTELYRSVSDNVSSRVIEFAHVEDLYRYTGAADVVITRAGATTIAELALQQKACILVPGEQLTGGQQTKNAQHLLSFKAVEVVSEDDADNPEVFRATITKLLDSKQARLELSKNIAKLAKPDASSELAQVVIELAQTRKERG